MVIYLLIFQGVLGGIDAVWNVEFHSWILTIFGMGALAWGIKDVSTGLVSSRYAKEGL